MENVKIEILQKMKNRLDKNELEELSSVLDLVLYKYQIKEKKEELVVYDDSNIAKLKKFIATKRLEGLAESTLQQYYRQINNMLETIGKPIHEIHTDDIRYYLSFYREQRKISKVTVNNMRRYLSTFFSWCMDEDIIQKNPMRRIKQIKQEKIVKEPFSEVQMELIRNTVSSARDRALVEIFYSTGCRVSEVVHIDLNDIDFAHNKVVVNGKGNKQREVYITEKAMFWLTKYLRERTDNNIALFIGKGGKRLQKSGVENVFRHIGRKAKIEKVHPHRFRRTIATNLLNKGMPVQDVQQMLGHSSLDTTMLYCKVNSENVKAEHKKYAT